MRQRSKNWLLIVALLLVIVVLGGCTSMEDKKDNVNNQQRQEIQQNDYEARFKTVEIGEIKGTSKKYQILVENSTNEMYGCITDRTSKEVIIEPIVDEEGNPLLYEGDLTAKKQTAYELFVLE